jgi:ABC-type multidrug transport system fused ATPase/permease subunit
MSRRVIPIDGEKPKFSWEKTKEALRIFQFIKPYRFHFFGGMILLGLSSVVFMIFPYLAGEMTDVATGKTKLGLTLDQIALVLLGILVFQGVVSYFRVILFAHVSEKGMADVRRALYQKLISLPVHFFEKNRVGELTSRMTTDVNNLQTVFSITLAEFFRQILILIVGIIYLLFTTPTLSYIMLGTFPVIVVGAMFFGRYIRNKSRERQKTLADTNTIVDESLQNIQTVKSFTNEPYEFQRYSVAIGKVVKVALKLASYRAIFSTFIIIILFGGIFFILWFGASLVANGKMTIGELVAFIAYTAIIGGAIGGLGSFYTQILTAIGGTERIREILSEESETQIDQIDQLEKRFNGNIVFDQVGFSYPSRKDLPIFEDLSLQIKAGEKIALVGQSGAGKSTIASLLLRLYQVQSGDITIDGKSIYAFPISGYRSQFGLVPQEVLLFGGTIRENIRYGKPEATEEEIIQASERSHCMEFIRQFPEGFDTLVGERGVKLSGGQRQRIAIARAILKDPAILILDEATSALDAESEAIVQSALDALMANRTSVIIAHRLATIKKVDCIFVIDNGRIIEQGNHEELSGRENGAYSSLAKLQFELN